MFQTRKILHGLIYINLLIPLILRSEGLFGPNFSVDLLNFGLIFYNVLNFAIQILVSCSPNKEFKLQRIIAISLSIFRIIFWIIYKIAHNVLYYNNLVKANPKNVFSIDILFISTVITYYMYKDYLNFGYGLNEQIEKEKKRISI